MAYRFSDLHHIGIVVRDLEASAAWYARHFGLERIYEYGFPGVRAMFIGHEGLRIELFETEGASSMAPERMSPPSNVKIGGINHLAIAVDDLEAAIADLRAGDVEVVSEPRDVPDGHGDRFAFVHDNEGMLVELFQQAPQAG